MPTCKTKLILLIFIAAIFKTISANDDSNNNSTFQIVIPENDSAKEQQNKTIEELVEEQTDLIKKILSDQKVTTYSDYPPILLDKDIDNIQSSKEEKERKSIEELRRRCQQIFYLSLRNNMTELKKEVVTNKENQNIKKITTVEAFGPVRKPEFLQKTTKPSPPSTQKPPENLSPPIQIEQTTKRYFFITRNQSTLIKTNNNKNEDSSFLESKTITKPDFSTVGDFKSQELQATQTLAQPNIKYMRLEPVILQKMVLNNGRMLFYWYKSIPAIPQLISIPRYSSPLQVQQHSYGYSQPQLSNYQSQASNLQENYSTTTNEEKVRTSQTSSDLVPQYEIEYSKTDKNDENLYRKQLKFVIPIPYPNGAESGEVSRQYPWQFDPYAYYPKSLQPATVNVPMSYVPTFQMIKTLRVPENGNNQK